MSRIFSLHTERHKAMTVLISCMFGADLKFSFTRPQNSYGMLYVTEAMLAG